MCQGAEGARSISDLARSAVARLIADKKGGGPSTFEQKLENLQAQLQMLTELLAQNQRSLAHDVTQNESQEGRTSLSVPESVGGN
jgi:hypothetical protein